MPTAQMPQQQAYTAPMPQQPSQQPQQPAYPAQTAPSQYPPSQMPPSQYPPSQTPYPAPGQQPKKSRKGLIAGIAIGGVALLAALGIGGFFLFNSTSEPDDPTIPVISTPPVDIDPGNNTDPVTTTPPSSGSYTHDLIGISLDLLDGWEAADSDMYPDEVLGLYHYDYDYAFVWIDRYPNFDAALFTSDQELMLSVYTGGFEGNVTRIITEDDVSINGLSWHHVAFDLTSPDEDFFIDYYVTDMPNNRGVFMYAIICPILSPGQKDHLGYDDAYKMFKSLSFTK